MHHVSIEPTVKGTRKAFVFVDKVPFVDVENADNCAESNNASKGNRDLCDE